MFSIRESRQNRRLYIEVEGIWHVEMATQYRQQLHVSLSNMKRTGAYFDSLIALGANTILPQDAVPIIKSTIDDQCAAGLRRCAYITQSVVQGLQARRFFNDESMVRYFPTIALAELWIEEIDKQ